MATDSASNEERRNYYRVDDVVHLEYRVVPEEEVSQLLDDSKRPQPPGDDLADQFAAINKQINPLLTEIRRNNVPLAKFLEGLNTKLDLLAARTSDGTAPKEQADGRVVSRIPVNLSAGGIAFNTSDLLHSGDYLHVRIGTSTSGYLINTYGRVIDCRPSSGGDRSRPHRVRVEFPFLDAAERKMLMRHTLSVQRQAIREQTGEEGQG